jgi:putative endonuclease
MHYVYIVKCADGTYYTGYTNDLKRRIKQHNAGEGAKYTKGRRPVELVHSEQFETKSEAMKREYKIKQLKRQSKIEIINQV